MYCRVCGSLVNDKADICLKCGCRPLNGNAYCQECGAATTEKQELCIRCGCRLKKITGNPTSVMDSLNRVMGELNRTPSASDVSEAEINPDFSPLPPYYQRKFQRILDSNETYKGGFNIWAFLFGPIWAITKGCWLSAIVAFITSIATSGVGGVIWWFIYGFRGTYMYYCSYVKGKQKII